MDVLVADTAVEDERREVLMLEEDGTYINNNNEAKQCKAKLGEVQRMDKKIGNTRSSLFCLARTERGSDRSRLEQLSVQTGTQWIQE